MSGPQPKIIVRNTSPEDFAGIIEMCREVYPESQPWNEAQLASHLNVFPEGQFVAVEQETGRVAGAAASLIVDWDDYEFESNWRDLTNRGYFTNHDPVHGLTLYGAEVMVRPGMQGHGIGKKLYAARRELTQRLGLLRIRAGSRLRGYHRYADKLTPKAYVQAVVDGRIGDPTLTFQLRQGFHVLAVTPSYLKADPESLGNAAVIEWVNRKVATLEDYEAFMTHGFVPGGGAS